MNPGLEEINKVRKISRSLMLITVVVVDAAK